MKGKYKNRQHRPRTRFKTPLPYHVDNEWITSKINGQGGCHTVTGNSTSLVYISYIGTKSQIVICYYNLILLGKYLLRRIKFYVG